MSIIKDVLFPFRQWWAEVVGLMQVEADRRRKGMCPQCGERRVEAEAARCEQCGQDVGW